MKKNNPSAKRRSILLGVSAVGLLAIAVALLLLLPAIRARFPGKSAAVNPLPHKREQRQLRGGDSSAIRQITVEKQGQEKYTLLLENGQLLLQEGDETADVNDAYAAEIIEVVSLVKVSDRVAEDAAEVEPYLGDMGLNPPLAVVTVQLADGGTYSLFIGGIVPETTYRYFRWSEDPGVFMCDTGVGDVFLLEKNRLRPVQQPVIASGLVDRVSIQKGEGLVEVSLSADAGGNLSAMLTSPFQYPMDETYLSALKTALDNFRLGALERAYSEDISAEYGFDDPLAVVTLHQKGGVRMMTDETGALTTIQMGETSFRFTFGRLEGEYYYTCLYEGNVYLVSRYLVETLVMAEGEKWASLYPFRMDSSRMGSILITTPSATLDIHAAYREQVSQNNTILLDEEGNIAYDITVSVNGKPWNTDAFDTLVARLFMLRASGSVPEGFSIEGKTPRWSMKLTTVFGQTRLVEAYSMDSFSDVLAVDGTVLHYVHYETLQTLLGELAQEISF